uniref:exosome RNA helicase MTR4 n=1 Tax=Ciona intestinalis TaxID=7719 RepID=UPI000180B332|nr:exosome RNA helicase MTR4 [Ciona intestinalis]|eukprot:XP_002131169.1 exosome RNA helicase MTR4 [Ciona intestinalis]
MAGFGDEIFNVFDEESDEKSKSPRKSTAKRPKISDDSEKLPEKKQKCEEEEDETKIRDETEKLSELPPPPKDEVEDFSSLLEALPKVETKSMESLITGCTHEVAFQSGSDVPRLLPKAAEPAKEYKFILDPFQQEALLCLDNNQSVLVSAHTSAGKTVVAEYAIAMCLRDKQRVIYTTPIKALSNQKYRDLYEEFSDVGLMTGDVTINPTASCLVMTTEILRSMLYRGSEVMREVAWVVFDEIHYMRNKERGVVWEETIILLPDNVRYVFLSATIPNARQFASWICHLHKQPCHVVYTDYRPVPLQHYIFPAGGDGLHLVVDDNGDFREDNFNTAMAVLRDAGDNAKSDFNRRGKQGGQRGKSGCIQIVELIMERKFLPAIVFSFSKKECEFYANQVQKLKFNSTEERKLVQEVFDNAMDSLSEEDRRLPQVEACLPFVLNGIGIHHGGLLPIIKETIEILFSEGLIKVLFATETFSMGVNMPAHTVVFTSIRKFDGKDFRWITGGEYIQMSGRAGRRGMDENGLVIMMVDEKLSPSVGKALVKGSPDPLDSAFRLTYNMVLNLLRVEEINPEYMLEKSFYQFQHYTAIPEMLENVSKLETEYSEMKIKNEEESMTYYRIRQQLNKLASQLEEFVHLPKFCLPFLQPGRLVKVRNGEHEFGWGVVVNFQKKQPKSSGPMRGGDEPQPEYVVDVLLNCDKEGLHSVAVRLPRPAKDSLKSEMAVVPIMLPLIKALSSVRLFLPKDLRPLDNRQSLLRALEEVKKRFPDGIPLLDPVEDMSIKDDRLKSIVKKTEAFERRMYKHPLHTRSDVTQVYQLCENKTKLANKVKEAKRALKKARTILQMDELKCRKRVLRRLGYATMSDVIETKGRVACEISAADELLLTELIFNGVFNNLTPAQCAALLCCFVFDEKSKSIPKLSEELATPLRQLHETARKIAKVSNESKLVLDEEEYVQKFKTMLMDVVHSWCNGSSFAKIAEMTDVFEGSIIRCMRRLEELLREMCHAAKAIGNTHLENKFSEGIQLIKRDIIFAASLYL